MKSIHRNLFIFLVLIIQLQLILSYPSSSNFNQQRTFLRCHFSAIACKRSSSTINENENPLSMINKNLFQACIDQNKSIRFCINHYQLEEDIKPND